MMRLAEVAAARGIWIVLDLCYEKLIYDAVAHNLPKVLGDRMRDRTILTGSASKAYAMTGWRCGWLLAPPAVVAACNAIQSHCTSNVCSITQKAVVAALTGPQQCVTDMLDEYRRRRDLIRARVTAGHSLLRASSRPARSTCSSMSRRFSRRTDCAPARTSARHCSRTHTWS